MIFLPPGWTWQGVVPIVISLIALTFSIATFRQRIRYHPQPKIVGEWHPAHATKPLDLPAPTLYITNHGDAPARDVRVHISTRPEDPMQTVVVDADKAVGRFEVPLSRQHEGKFDEQTLDYVWRRTLPLDQVRWERPVVTIRWRQAPFGNRPRIKRFRVPRKMLVHS